MAGGVQAGVQPQFLASFQYGSRKIRLEKGISPGKGDASARRQQEIPVAGYFFKDVGRASAASPPHVGGVRIVAVAAAQAAPGQEEDKADAWTVHGAAGFHGMDQSGDGSFTVRGRILGESLRHPLPGWVNGYGRCG